MSYDIEANQPATFDKLDAVTQPAQSKIPTTAMHPFPDPFSDSMSHVFFSGADRRILLDEVIHLCQFGNNLVAVVGDEGVGKTSFLNQAGYELSESAFCCQLVASYGMSAENLLAQVLSQLDLSFSDSATAGEMIATLRHSMVEGNLHRVVVIIDDAHELDDGILSALISLLQGHQGHHLHILMAGDPNLIERLDGFDMVDVLVYDVTLKPFSDHETKDYLDFKLTTAGYPSERLVSENDAHQIWKESRGYPSKIHNYAAALLYQQDLIDDENISRPVGLPLVHMGLLVVLLAGLILALIYMGGEDEGEAPEIASQQEALKNIADTTAEAVAPALSPETTPANNAVVNGESALLASNSDSVTAERSLEETAEQQKSDLTSTVENQQVAAAPSESAQSAGETAVQAESKSLPPADVKVAPQESVKPTVTKPVSNVQESAEAAALASELKQEAESLRVETSPTVASAKDHDWLMALSDSDYVLQVLAASQRASVERFVNAQPNREVLKLLTLTRDSKPWYVVVIGSYSSNESARRGINSLPQAQVNGGPWPRKASELKREIEAFGRN